MKLEVGMYVRTKAGMIAKIVSKEDVSGSLHREEIVFILDNGNKLALHSKKVIKVSHNIIDLIEPGDYVNGVMVESMNNSIKPIPIPQYKNECGEYIDFDESDIKSIVTREQFSAMEYRLGDK
jgi:hypothetical protein